MLFEINDNITCPAFKHGRWYHFLIESTGSAYTHTLKDLDITTQSGVMFLPKDYHILDYKLDIEATPDALATITRSIKIKSDGTQGIVIPTAAQMDHVEVWVFAHSI